MPGKHVVAATRGATRPKYAGSKPAAANDIPPGATIVTTAEQLSHIVRTEILAAREESPARAAEGPRLLTRAELADALRVSQGMIDVLRRRGMPFRKIGDSPRFELGKCLDWIDTDQAQDGA